MSILSSFTHKSSLRSKWINKFWYIHTVKHSSAIIRNSVPIQAATRMSFICIMLSERRQTGCIPYGILERKHCSDQRWVPQWLPEPVGEKIDYPGA